jgi:dihydropteroate synthase
MVNDVSAMTFDAGMADAVARLGVPVCLMHMRGEPRTMQIAPTYGDVVSEVRDWLAARVEAAVAAGVRPERIVVDPGFGFGKTVEHNLTLVRRLREIASLGYPVLLGVSRKSTIGAVLGGAPPDERLEGTAAAVAIGIANGAAIVRVHDVREMVRVVRVADAIVRGPAADRTTASG